MSCHGFSHVGYAIPWQECSDHLLCSIVEINFQNWASTTLSLFRCQHYKTVVLPIWNEWLSYQVLSNPHSLPVFLPSRGLCRKAGHWEIRIVSIATFASDKFRLWLIIYPDEHRFFNSQFAAICYRLLQCLVPWNLKVLVWVLVVGAITASFLPFFLGLLIELALDNPSLCSTKCHHWQHLCPWRSITSVPLAHLHDSVSRASQRLPLHVYCPMTRS